MDSKSNLYGFGSSIYPPLFENEPPPLNDKSTMNEDWFDLGENVIRNNDKKEEFDNWATIDKSADEEICFHDSYISGKQSSLFHFDEISESIYNFKEQKTAGVDTKNKPDDLNLVKKEENSELNSDIISPPNSLMVNKSHEFSASNANVDEMAFRESYFDQATSSHFFNDTVNVNNSLVCDSSDENNESISIVTKIPLFNLKESNDLDFFMAETVHIDSKIIELGVIKENNEGCCTNFPAFSHTDVTENGTSPDFPEHSHLPSSSNTNTDAMHCRFYFENKLEGKVSEYEEYSLDLNFDCNQSDVNKANVFHIDHQKTSKNESSEFKNESVWVPTFTGLYDSVYLKPNEESVDLFCQSNAEINTKVNRESNIHSEDTDSNFFEFRKSSKFLFNDSHIKSNAIDEEQEFETTNTTLKENLQSTDNLGFTPSECYKTNFQETKYDKSYLGCVDNERFNENFITSLNPSLSDFNESFNNFCSFNSIFQSTSEEWKDNSSMDDFKNRNLFGKYEESIPSKAFYQEQESIKSIEMCNSATVQIQFSEFSDFGDSPIAFNTEKNLDFNPFSSSDNESVLYAPASDTHDSNISTTKQSILQSFHLSEANFGDKYEIFNLSKLDEKVGVLCSRASKVFRVCFPVIDSNQMCPNELFCSLGSNYLSENVFNLWSELEISGEDAGRWLAQYYFSEHFKKQILSFNIHFKLSSIDILMPEPVCLPVSKNTLLAKSQEKKSWIENMSYSKSLMENNSGSPSETASLDLDFFASNNTAISEDLNHTVSPILELINLEHPAKISLSSQKDDSFLSSKKYEEANDIFPSVNQSLSGFDVLFSSNFSSTFDNDNADIINKMTTFSSEANFKKSSGSIYKEGVNYNKEDKGVVHTVSHEQSPINFETQVPDFWHEKQQNFTADFENAFSENHLPNLVSEKVSNYELIFKKNPIKPEKSPDAEKELKCLEVSQPSRNFDCKDLIFINGISDSKNISCLTEVGENTIVRTCSNSEDSDFNSFQVFNDAENPGLYFKQSSSLPDLLNEDCVVAENKTSVYTNIQTTSYKEQLFGTDDAYLSNNPVKKLDSSYNNHFGNHELPTDSLPDLDLNIHMTKDCKLTAHTNFSAFDWNEINKDNSNSKMSKPLDDSLKNTFAEFGDFDSKLVMQDSPLFMNLKSESNKSEEFFTVSPFPSSIDLDFFTDSAQNSFTEISNPRSNSEVKYFTTPHDTPPVKIVQSVSPLQAVSSFTHISTLPQDFSKSTDVSISQNCIETQNNTQYLTASSNPPIIDNFSDRYSAFKTLDCNLGGFSEFNCHNKNNEEFLTTKEKKTFESGVLQSEEWFSSTQQTSLQNTTPAFSTVASSKKEERLDEEFGEFVKSNVMCLSYSPLNATTVNEKHLVLTENNLDDLNELNQPNVFKKQFQNLSLNQQNTFNTQDAALQNPNVQNYQGFLQRQCHQNQLQHHENLHNQNNLQGTNPRHFQQPQKAAKPYSNTNDPFSVFSMENTAKQLSLPIANKALFKHNKPKVKLNDIHSSRN